MANNNDNRNKLLSALITLLLGAGIVALLIFTSLHYNYPPKDGEQLTQLLQDTIMFGGEYVDFGDFLEEQVDDQLAAAQPTQPQESESPNNEPQVGQNDLSDNGQFDESPQQHVTNNAQESPMKVQQQQPKKQPAEKKTEQPQPNQPPKKQGNPNNQPANKTTQQPTTPSAPANSSSEANDRVKNAFAKNNSGSGKQGNPDGTAGADKSVGKPGVGGLEGYTIAHFPTAKCPGPGTVVVRVTVGTNGAVTSARVVSGSLAGNERARNICLSLARQSRFSVPKGQAVEKTGTLTYTIR